MRKPVRAGDQLVDISLVWQCVGPSTWLRRMAKRRHWLGVGVYEA